MNAAELKSLSDRDLVHRALETERNLMAARFSHSMNQLEDTSELRVLRRDIARLRTEARARELAEGLAKDSLFQLHRGSFSTDAAAADDSVQAEKGGFLQGIVDKLTGKE